MAKRTVLTDGNDSDLIQVEGLGVYVPLEKLRAAEAERDALAAQVEALQSRIGAAERVEAIFSEAPELSFVECKKLFPEEIRELRAEAGRAGFVEGVRQEMLDKFGLFYLETQDRANQYADSIRQGGAE